MKIATYNILGLTGYPPEEALREIGPLGSEEHMRILLGSLRSWTAILLLTGRRWYDRSSRWPRKWLSSGDASLTQCLAGTCCRVFPSLNRARLAMDPSADVPLLAARPAPR